MAFAFCSLSPPKPPLSANHNPRMCFVLIVLLVKIVVLIAKVVAKVAEMANEKKNLP